MLLVEPYWDFWEGSVDFDLRADRAALAAQVRDRLDVEWVERDDAEVAVVLQTMATPPARTRPLIEGLPVVIWAAHRRGAPGERFDHGAITSEGATVGAPMLSSVLVREGRPFELVLGRIDDDAAVAAVEDAIVAAAVASRLRSARIGRVGRPLDGYECVDTDGELLRLATGIELVPISPEEVRELYLAVTETRVRELARQARATFDVRIDGEELQRSLRAACAIEDLVERHRLDAGAMNCHVPEIRFGEQIGIAPCMGLGRSTSMGVPWTCVGDVLTAVAMLVTTALGHCAQYHELEAVDYETGELVIASSGEYDLRLARGPRPQLVRNGWFSSDRRAGACARFTIPAGPATLVGFAQVGEQYRIVAAEGRFSGRPFEATGTANGGFRFDRGLTGWVEWCRTGANHHSSATSGSLGQSIRTLARFLGVEAAVV